MPGAFTPTCSLKHLPGFIEKADELKAKGVETIACVAVNDAFVMDAWGKSVDAGDKVMLLADGSALFTKARARVPLLQLPASSHTRAPFAANARHGLGMRPGLSGSCWMGAWMLREVTLGSHAPADELLVSCAPRESSILWVEGQGLSRPHATGHTWSHMLAGSRERSAVLPLVWAFSADLSGPGALPKCSGHTHKHGAAKRGPYASPGVAACERRALAIFEQNRAALELPFFAGHGRRHAA